MTFCCGWSEKTQLVDYASTTDVIRTFFHNTRYLIVFFSKLRACARQVGFGILQVGFVLFFYIVRWSDTTVKWRIWLQFVSASCRMISPVYQDESHTKAAFDILLREAFYWALIKRHLCEITSFKNTLEGKLSIDLSYTLFWEGERSNLDSTLRCVVFMRELSTLEL